MDFGKNPWYEDWGQVSETDWIRRNDSSTIGSNSEATLTVEKEYAVRDAEIVNAKKHLVFKRCAVDQSWSGYACTGKPGLYSVREALDYGRHSKYGSWRIPTQDELKDLLDYFSDGYGYQVFSAELYERWFWTSSKASQRAAYRVIQLDGRLDQPWSRNGSSEQIPKASIILVRSF